MNAAASGSLRHGTDIGTISEAFPETDRERDAEAIPGAQLEIVENKGHFFWLDDARSRYASV